MSSTFGRLSSHAPARPSSAHQHQQHDDNQHGHHHHRTPSGEHRRHSQGGTSAAPGSHKRRADHGQPGDAKRRRPNSGVVSADELLTPSIVAHPPNPLSRPCTLLPLMLLPREHLPLSCLDLAATKGDLPSSRTCQSAIRILELEGRLGSSSSVLIARSPSSNGGSSGSGAFSSASSLFAIERDSEAGSGSGLYVLCKLGNWVDIHRLSEHATAVCQQRMPAAAVPKEEPASSSSKGGAVPVISAQEHKERGKKRLAIAELQSFVRRKPVQPVADEGLSAQGAAVAGNEDAADSSFVSNAGDLPPRPTSPTAVADPSASKAGLPTPPASDSNKVVPPAMEPPEPTGPPTAEDIFQNIRHQYMEALYHSMGSLAYFAKGPLSRARAAFHLDCDANLEMGDLIDFLKGLVLTTTVIDKKYRETVPELVARLRTLGSLSEQDEEPSKRKSKTPKKKKKIKLGSNGLYTDEDAHIQTWWNANKPAPRDDEVYPRNEEVKYVLSRLRTRETQMQMILILEIMALDAVRPAGDAAEESQLPGMIAPDDPATISKKKKKSKHNFPLLIDVHADRLCIWQSTVSDEVRALAESQARPGGDVGVDAGQTLKDFCVDIIVPFFYPRLPLVCDSLNRKLGGPVIATPGRHKSKPKPSGSGSLSGSGSHRSPSDKVRDKAASAKHQLQRARPGSSLRRTASASASNATNAAQSLERVLSNERLRRSVSRGPNDAIAQLRSATAAAVPGLKRETSEPAALASIPRRVSSSASASASTTTATSRSLSRSQSEMGAARMDEARARKKALVEAQLQEAISALKKPNRELAGKAVVEDAEKRLLVAKRTRQPQQQLLPPTKKAPDVQVKATPVSNRIHDVFVTTSTQSQSQGRGRGRGLFAPYGQSHSQRHDFTFVATSPRVAVTPSANRIIQATPSANRIVQATPATTVPDSAVKVKAAAVGGPSRRSSEFARPLPPLPGSSPLQARSQNATVMAERTSVVFATPTKARTIDLVGAAAGSILATPPPAAAAAAAPAVPVAPTGLGTGVQSLYQQLGWDDDVDDLA